MSSFVGYSKKGLPHSLIHVHDILIKDFVVYFEKGKECRRGIKKVRKAIKKAFKIAKKKKINPAESIGEAREVLEGLWVEVELTRKALLATSARLKDALDQIQQERIDRPSPAISPCMRNGPRS